MILALGLILLCQLLGEAVARGIGLPFPGPVLGLLICVGLLVLRDRVAGLFPTRIAAELRDGTFERTAGRVRRHAGCRRPAEPAGRSERRCRRSSW